MIPVLPALPRALLIAFSLSSAVAAAAAPSAAPVVAAERACAADTFKKGFKQGFLAYAAEGGLIFQPGPVRARPLLQRLPDARPPGPPLQWWPTWAGIANSGDLGFTTGPASIPVRYFTVWKKQSDGSWKWIYDGGPALKAPMGGRPEDPVTYLKPASAAAGSPDAALAEVAQAEDDLATLAAADSKKAHLKYLAEDGITAGSDQPSFTGRASQSAELDRRPPQVRLKALGGSASQAGDMAFTYGEARWSAGAKPGLGHYARIWQKRTEGWKLVADMLVVAPPPPPNSKESTASR